MLRKLHIAFVVVLTLGAVASAALLLVSIRQPIAREWITARHTWTLLYAHRGSMHLAV